jgi:hypothetical protein
MARAALVLAKFQAHLVGELFQALVVVLVPLEFEGASSKLLERFKHVDRLWPLAFRYQILSWGSVAFFSLILFVWIMIRRYCMSH